MYNFYFYFNLFCVKIVSLYSAATFAFCFRGGDANSMADNKINVILRKMVCILCSFGCRKR